MNEYLAATIGWTVISIAMLASGAIDHAARLAAAELRARRRAKLVHRRITRSIQRLEIRQAWKHYERETRCEK